MGINNLWESYKKFKEYNNHLSIIPTYKIRLTQKNDETGPFYNSENIFCKKDHCVGIELYNNKLYLINSSKINIKKTRKDDVEKKYIGTKDYNVRILKSRKFDIWREASGKGEEIVKKRAKEWFKRLYPQDNSEVSFEFMGKWENES